MYVRGRWRGFLYFGRTSTEVDTGDGHWACPARSLAAGVSRNLPSLALTSRALTSLALTSLALTSLALTSRALTSREQACGVAIPPVCVHRAVHWRRGRRLLCPAPIARGPRRPTQPAKRTSQARFALAPNSQMHVTGNLVSEHMPEAYIIST